MAKRSNSKKNLKPIKGRLGCGMCFNEKLKIVCSASEKDFVK